MKQQLGYENQIKPKHNSKVEFTKCKVELIINNKLLGIYSNRGASVENALASNNTFRGIHSNGSDNAFTQMLRHLQHKPQRVIQNLQRGHDRRQTLVEFDINDDTNDLADLPYRTLPDEFISPNRAKRWKAWPWKLRPPANRKDREPSFAILPRPLVLAPEWTQPASTTSWFRL